MIKEKPGVGIQKPEANNIECRITMLKGILKSEVGSPSAGIRKRRLFLREFNTTVDSSKCPALINS
jgi:hypothetical protein